MVVAYTKKNFKHSPFALNTYKQNWKEILTLLKIDRAFPFRVNLCRGMGPNNHACGLTNFVSMNEERRDNEDIEVETLQRGRRSLAGSRPDNPPTEKERMA